MANPYEQAANIAAPYAGMGTQILAGANAYERGKTHMQSEMAKQFAMQAHADLYGAQAGKARAEAMGLEQENLNRTPEGINRLASSFAGLNEPQAREMQAYRKNGNWGVDKGYSLPDDQAGPVTPDVQKSAPQWYSPQVQSKYNVGQLAGLVNASATGKTDGVKLFESLLGQGRTQDLINDPKMAGVVAQAVAAAGGNDLFDNMGTNTKTGVQTLTPFGRSEVGKNNATAGNQSSMASLHRAQIPEVQSRIDLNKSKIGQTQTVTMPDGTVVSTGASMPKLTEIQAKSQLFGSRAAESDRIIRDLEGKYSPVAVNAKLGAEGIWGVGGALGLAGNSMLSKEGQMAEQAQRDFINAILRQESGAAIADSEFNNARKQYFPQPGDGKDVLAQKSQNRKLAIEGLKVMAGPASGMVNYGGKQQDKNSALAEAKAAIEAGAPRDLVIKRLKEMGVDGGGI